MAWYRTQTPCIEWSELISAQAPDIVVTNCRCWRRSVLRLETGAKLFAWSEKPCRLGMRARLLNHQISKWFDGLVYISDFDGIALYTVGIRGLSFAITCDPPHSGGYRGRKLAPHSPWTPRITFLHRRAHG